ncbi:HSP20-like chaperone [Schizophyllum amplum]|uniref:HSP20-like chaperone n=1 Tax=Schizophyllum amplum TaxID=97359 RepID=A0A550C1E8_9AGAR|nr:HSP20-like chaperone [Auriculariopsis ampla]
MSVFHYEPFYDIERFFDDAFGSRALRSPDGQRQRSIANATTNEAPRSNYIPNPTPRALKPRMDLHEDAEHNVVTATFELPGVKKEDVQIEFHNGRLTVGAESRISEERKGEGYAIRERRFGKWSRTLQLPTGTKDEDIKASMENGVLTVTFPKTSPEEAQKKIAVN